jgi:hypothetical protein
MGVFTVGVVQASGKNTYGLVPADPPPSVPVGSTLDLSVASSTNYRWYDYGEYSVLAASWMSSPDGDGSWSNFRVLSLNYTHMSYTSLAGKQGVSPIKNLFASPKFQITQLIMVSTQFQADSSVTVEDISNALVNALRGSSVAKVNGGKKGVVNLTATTVKIGDGTATPFGSNSKVQSILTNAFENTITFTF